MAPRKQSTPKQDDAAKNADKKGTRERKQYAPVSLDLLKPQKVTKEEKVTVLPGRERSEEQKAVDAAVKDIAYDNINAGLPKQFRDMPVLKYTLPAAQAETVKFMIQKAGNFLNCKIKFGRAAWDENGNEVVTFAAIPRDPKQWTDAVPVGETSETTAETPAETPAESTGETSGETLTDPSAFMTD